MKVITATPARIDLTMMTSAGEMTIKANRTGYFYLTFNSLTINRVTYQGSIHARINADGIQLENVSAHRKGTYDGPTPAAGRQLCALAHDVLTELSQRGDLAPLERAADELDAVNQTHRLRRREAELLAELAQVQATLATLA